MISTTITIENAEGLHLRPAQMLADAAGKFASDITLRTGDGGEANVKSVLGVIALGLEKGATITLTADGEDEAAALEAVAELFAKGFGEQP